MTVVHFVSHHFLNTFYGISFYGQKIIGTTNVDNLTANHHILFVRLWSKKKLIQDAK